MDWAYIEEMLITSDYKGKQVKREVLDSLKKEIERLEDENKTLQLENEMLELANEQLRNDLAGEDL